MASRTRATRRCGACQQGAWFDERARLFDWRVTMEKAKFAGLSLRAEVFAVLAAMLASALSFTLVVLLYGSASGDLSAVVATLGAAPAASSVATQAPRKPKPKPG